MVNPEGLSNVEIEQVLRDYEIDYFPIKVGGIDELDKNFKSGIINYQSSYQGGTHWTAYYIRGNDFLYFDSFGASPKKEIIAFADHKRIVFNDGQIQAMDSVLCGWYCIFFLIHIIGLGWEYEKIISIFDPVNQNKNEQIIVNFFGLKDI